MSTPNFYNKNASKIFASECDERDDYNDLIGNVRYAIKESKEISEGDYDRNYPATKFSEIDIESGKWLATIYLTCRSGYYSGMNLDWEIEILDQKQGDADDKESGGDFWEGTEQQYLAWALEEFNENKAMDE